MSVVGVKYTEWKPVRAKPIQDPPLPPVGEDEEPIWRFKIQRRNYRRSLNIESLHDCDDGEWFAIIDKDGALVTRRGLPMQPGHSPLEAVGYGTPMVGGTRYFGGSLGGGRYCIATRSAHEVRILEVLPGRAPLMWCTVGMAGEPDGAATCETLLYGDTLVCCSRRGGGDRTHKFTIGRRALNKREDGTWHLGEVEQMGRFTIQWSLEAGGAGPEVHQVCAVPSGARDLSVFILVSGIDFDDEYEGDSGRTTRLYRVNIPQNHPPRVELHSEMIQSEPMVIHMGIMQSGDQAYMTCEKYILQYRFAATGYSSDVLRIKYVVQGLTNDLRYEARCETIPDSGDDGDDEGMTRWGEATLPGCGILISEFKTGECRGELLMKSSEQPPSIVARTEIMQGDPPPLAAFPLRENGFVWLDYVVNLRRSGSGIEVCFARCFRVDADSVHANMHAPQRSESIKMRPIKNRTGGVLGLKLAPLVNV